MKYNSSFFSDFTGFSYGLMKGIVASLFNFQQLEGSQDIKYIHILSWLVFLLLLSSFGVLFFTVLRRHYQSYIQSRNQRCIILYEATLIDFLFGNTELQLKQQFLGLKGYKKSLFIDALVRLNLQVAGPLNDKLRLLFMETCHAFTLQRLTSNSPGLKIFGLRVLSHMNIGITEVWANTLLDSFYASVRSESLIALSAMNPEAIISMLEKKKLTLSMWEQMNLYNNLLKNSIKHASNKRPN
jgi:hypothetical protein